MSGAQQDHFELSRLVDRFCDGVIRRDVDTWSATWADDLDVVPEWQMRGDPIIGKQAIVDHWLETMTRFEWVVQTAPHRVFDVDENADAGVGRVVAQETFKLADGGMGGLLAVYHDRYARTSAGWRFSARTLDIKHFS